MNPIHNLATLLWPDEVREPDIEFLPPQSGEHERRMAEQLVMSMSVETFAPGNYRDHSREALQALIDAKLADRRVAVPAPRTPEAADLEEALRASLAEARRERAAERGR